MANKDDNKPDASSALPALALHVPNKPTPLPVASHLHGLDNYDVWTIQLQALVGVHACKVIDGKPREDGSFDPILWDRLNEFVILTIVISADQSVIHHIAGCKRTAAAYWTALRDIYCPSGCARRPTTSYLFLGTHAPGCHAGGVRDVLGRVLSRARRYQGR
ncbi:hypothetical protein JCM3774_005810 [Rhodotorula dairenensis]